MIVSVWGFMGCGKSTVGKEFARLQHWQHIDSDEQIEKEEGNTITDIFRTHGEYYFRQLETAFLKRMVQKENTESHILLTTGGGMPIRAENRKLLHQLGPSVFIDVSFDEIVRRVGKGSNRPLWQADQLCAMQERYATRLTTYRQADFVVQADELTSKDVQLRILDWLHFNEHK